MPPRPRSCWLTGLIPIVLVALGAGQAIAQTGHVSGQVKDADTGKPVKGATVVAENAEASPASFTSATDDKGRFSMLGLRGGLWMFTASAPGYQPERGAARVQAMSSNPSMVFGLRKQPEPYVSPLAGVDTKALLRDLAAADDLAAHGQWDDALAGYKAVEAKLPALTMVALEIGRVQRAKKDFASATATFEKLLEADPRNTQARAELAQTQIERGDLAAAERTLGEAKDDGDNRDFYFVLGELKLAQAQPEQAVGCYRKALAVDPQFAKAHFRLGMIAVNRGDAQGARTDLEKAIALDPDSAEATQARKLMQQLKD